MNVTDAEKCEVRKVTGGKIRNRVSAGLLGLLIFCISAGSCASKNTQTDATARYTQYRNQVSEADCVRVERTYSYVYDFDFAGEADTTERKGGVTYVLVRDGKEMSFSGETAESGAQVLMRCVGNRCYYTGDQGNRYCDVTDVQKKTILSSLCNRDFTGTACPQSAAFGSIGQERIADAWKLYCEQPSDALIAEYTRDYAALTSACEDVRAEMNAYRFTVTGMESRPQSTVLEYTLTMRMTYGEQSITIVANVNVYTNYTYPDAGEYRITEPESLDGYTKFDFAGESGL